MYYKVLIKTGHLGAGKSHEVARYLEAHDLDALLDSLKQFPGMKKKPSIGGMSYIKTISREEYDVGKICEWKRAYIRKNLEERDHSPQQNMKDRF